MSLGSIIGSIFASRLVYQPSKAKVYDGIGHIAILTDQRYGQELHVVEQLNHFVRHARIGKITLKAAA